jgi:prophage regulatory protein
MTHFNETVPRERARLDTLLSTTDLHRLGITYSATQLWRLCKSGQFPAPIKLGARRNAWRASDIEAWIASRQSVAA